MNRTELEKLTVSALKKMAEEQGVTIPSKLRKGEIVDRLLGKADSADSAASAKEEKKQETPLPEAAQLRDSVQDKKAEKEEPAAEKADHGDEKRRLSVSTGREHGLAQKNSIHTGQLHRSDGRGQSRTQNTASRNGASSKENSHKQGQKKKNDRYARIKDDISNTVQVSGPLEIRPEGYGLVANDGADSPYDHIYVSPSQIQKFRLRTGDILGGKVRPPKQGEKYAAMLFLEFVNGTETRQIINEMAQLMRSEQHESDSRFKESHTGILDVNPDGFGFLRMENYLPGEDDIYVAANQIRRYGLSTGDKITGKIRKSSEGEKNDALLYIEEVNGDIPETTTHRPKFENLLPVFPNERITLETKPDVLSTRMIDLFSPMGKGQRGMIVAPPKAGKTTLLKEIALGIRANHPEIELIILLVDERPEEVTDMRRSIDADIVCSTFDQPAQNHLAVSQMVLERSKRLVEQGKDVVVLVDSLTRLTRANNLCVEPSGRTLSGGIDPEALYFPKKFFGSARNIENGGSLTIIATALVETGSRMDDIIYEEFKGTGNMELHLERDLAQRRIYPAINLLKSGTRREDLLLNEQEMRGSFAIRKTFDSSAVQMTDKVITAMNKTRSNQEFLNRFVKQKP